MSAHADPRADELRQRYHELFSGDDLPVPVESIAEDLLGLSVAEFSLDGMSGLLYPLERRIVVNANDGPPRRRFTLAHELGHWVCQALAGHVQPVYCRADQVGVGEGRALEREANIFAAELLMPEPLVRKKFAASGRLKKLATDVGVSEEAMHWRLYNLGLSERPPSANEHSGR